MTTWVVGDIQGCKKPLKRLLEEVKFDWNKDVLWSTGDLVNRGPKCLQTLRYFYKHRRRVRVVLGNHDLHLLAVAAGAHKPGRSDTFDKILDAPDRDRLLNWLRKQPLLYREHGFTLVHAGIPPQWSITQAAARAREVETVLQGPNCTEFLAAMYGNEPSGWDDDLQGMERLRLITNYLTRMRYCYADGRLDLISKGPLNNPGGPAADDEALDAWFNHENRATAYDRVIFGHWASLQGKTSSANAIGLDTGCVWGNSMTLYCLETGARVAYNCSPAETTSATPSATASNITSTSTPTSTPTDTSADTSADTPTITSAVAPIITSTITPTGTPTATATNPSTVSQKK